ncbi:MAG: sugar ABC transporter ATP-binding protein [Christensenellales bacterium]
MEPILTMRGIDKKFGNFYALKDVDFDVYPGQVNVLMGENGAGKSTLMKILAGAHGKDAGEITLEGKQISIRTPREADELGIGTVYQELMLAPRLSVTENIFLGTALKTNGVGVVKWREMEKEAKEAIKELVGLDVDPQMLVSELGVAYQQLVEIARVIRQSKKILILDEPTAALTEQEIQRLFVTINRLKESGMAIVYISHRLEEIFQIGDRITVLRDGEMVGEMDVATATHDDVIKMMVGRSIEDKYPKADFSKIPKEEVLRVEGLSRQGVFEDISFSLHKGEILGFAGLMGAGRTEIARCLFGADRATGGRVFIRGKEVDIRNTRQAIAKGIALLPENRKAHGLVLKRNLIENTTLVNIKKVSSKLGRIYRKKEQQVTDEYIKRLKISVADKRNPASSLSGGNQQKVVIAKWLYADSDIIILDEPTRGIDVGAKTEVYHLINKFVLDGKAVIMISSELPELLGVCTRILTIFQGTMTGEFDNTADQETMLKAMCLKH